MSQTYNNFYMNFTVFRKMKLCIIRIYLSFYDLAWEIFNIFNQRSPFQNMEPGGQYHPSSQMSCRIFQSLGSDFQNNKPRYGNNSMGSMGF